MWTVFYVFIGGGIGSLMRYGLGVALPAEKFPLGVLACNLLGCLFIGIVAGLLDKPSALQIGIITGVLGGFTTFSSFSDATIKLIQNGSIESALGNVALSVVGGLLLTYLGYLITSTN